MPTIVTSAPISTIVRWVSAPTARTAMPSPTTTGQWDGAGRWMWSWVGAGGAPRGPYFSLQNVSLPRTGGIVSKSCGGGGDEVRHSSVRPSHGSAGAGAPARRPPHPLTLKRRTPAAHPEAPAGEAAVPRVQPAAPADG